MTVSQPNFATGKVDVFDVVRVPVYSSGRLIGHQWREVKPSAEADRGGSWHR